MPDIAVFVAAAIPVMVLLGARHALDVDHIAAIDNLVRMRGAVKSARWIGSLFSAGHMAAVCAEMVALIYIVKSLEAQATFQLLGGILGASMLALIGGVNLYSLRRFGRSGFGMIAQKMAETTRFAGNVGSPLLIGFVFGLGFDTATQISALMVSAVASATEGVQVALLLSAFFAAGMVPTDTLDSFFLREVFSRMTNTGAFRAMSYALSILAMSLALLEATGVATGIDLIPAWSGAFLAVSVIVTGISYSFVRSSQGNQREIPRHIIPAER
jgi:nickel/cobalt transporter (NiCoT) family protein